MSQRPSLFLVDVNEVAKDRVRANEPPVPRGPLRDSSGRALPGSLSLLSLSPSPGGIPAGELIKPSHFRKREPGVQSIRAGGLFTSRVIHVR